MRQGEDNVEVGHRQQFGGARGKPLGARVGLTLRTVAITTGVIGDRLMAAAKTLVAMTAQSCRPTTHDRIQDFAMLPGEVRAVPLPEAVARAAEDVGHLKGGAAHRCTRLLSRFISPSGVAIWMASSGLATACR